MLLDSRESAHYKCATDTGNGSAPIAIRPVTESSQPNDYQHSAEQGPFRGQPTLEHPAYCCAHESDTEPNSPERVAKHNLTGCKKQSLRRVKHRHVGRPLIDMECFEVDPHGVRRIGEPAVSERVRHQQIAELVMDSRNRD